MNIKSNEILDESYTESCDDCYVKICFASCYCISQMINILTQIISLYPKDNLIITTDSGNTISGRAGALYPVTYSGLFQLVDSQDRLQETVSICKIVSIAITSADYNENMIYNLSPEVSPTGCDAICEESVREYLSIGSSVQIKAGGKTVANGIVHINEYGVIVIVDKNNSNPVFVSTCKIESIK